MKETTVFKTPKGRQKILKVYKDLLKNVDFDYSEKYVETSFGTTYLLESGNLKNPAVFLLHGSSTNSAMWFGDIKALSEKYHVISIDIVGEAGHSEEKRLNLNNNDYALWLDEILCKLNITKANFIGNSFGGWMALKYSFEFSDKVNKIVLIASSGIVPIKLSFVFKSIFYVMQGEKGLKSLNKMVYGTDNIPDEVMKVSNLIMKNYNPMVGSLPVYTDEQLSKLTMPIMFIAGEHDATMDTAKAGKRLNHALRQPQINIIKDSGHVIYNTMKEVIPFLDGK